MTIIIKNSLGYNIYFEYVWSGDITWEKAEYNKNNNLIYFEKSNGYWEKSKYNSDNLLIYCEKSNGYIRKYKYNKLNNILYL